jgi:hypothetical protein
MNGPLAEFANLDRLCRELCLQLLLRSSEAVRLLVPSFSRFAVFLAQLQVLGRLLAKVTTQLCDLLLFLRELLLQFLRLRLIFFPLPALCL